MLRFAPLAFLTLTAFTGCAGCGKSAAKQEPPASAPAGPEKISVPGPSAEKESAPAPPAQDNPQFHLKDEEGTLTVAKVDAKVGSEATASIKVQPAVGYHVSQDFPIELKLEAPDGIKLSKTPLTAGGRDKSKGDAETLTEQLLEFGVKVTANTAGTYEIKGMFKFGVCDKDSCHPKKQPITIQLAAK
jgi:hypothetical protein